jgi:hypothetical protein
LTLEKDVIKMRKKALAPSISAILLIVLTMLILLIITLWLLGFFSESILKFNSPIEKSCNSIRFEASIIRAEDRGFPEIQISNTGSIPIFDFNIKYVSKNKESGNIYLAKSLEPGMSLSSEIIFGTIETERIIIYPVLLGSTKSNKNKQKICFDYYKEIILNQPL